jgi:hypothetical protein
MNEENEDIVEGVKNCPCCGNIPTIRHITEMEGAGAEVNCRCGLTMYAWDDYNSYKAEKTAIKRWNKTAERKIVKVMREED